MQKFNLTITLPSRDYLIEATIDDTNEGVTYIKCDCKEYKSGEIFSFIRKPQTHRIGDLEMLVLQEAVYELLDRK
jgi:hypothetical protein